MSVVLPELLDPRRAVATEAEFDGELPLRSLPRLREMLVDDDGVASYQLRFGQDGGGHEVIRGRVEAALKLRCQRCYETLVLDVSSDIGLALAEGLDEVSRLPEEYEPLLLPGRLIRASELIEDELILAVPSVPRHTEGQCRAPFAASTEPDRPPDVPADRPMHRLDDKNDRGRPNPFAGLAVLKPDRSD